MASEPQETSRGIHGIRDMALLLSLGNAYLCDSIFLKKIGLAIDTHLTELKSDILALKKQFPGRFENEVDADQVLEGIRITAQRLQKPDKEIAKKCSVGELGLELEASVDDLIETVEAIKMQVEGELVSYSAKEAILTQVDRVKSLGHHIVVSIILAFKLCGVLTLAGAIVFAYLFVSMESEEGLLKALDQSKRHIQAQIELISELEVEKRQVSKQIESTSQGELSRQEKVGVLDLDVKMYKLNEETRKAEIEISVHQMKVRDMERKVAELRKKTFLQRLLRQ